ncbi:MAG TPA: hypothetical protein VM008_18480 [Phycisphaerae bacterium]|nr:hypothetical protein [Phycisphaerae bacterium]
MSPTTIDRLKSLPLTIVLTVLIWMYAEAKFTATGDARISLRPVVPNGDIALRVFDSTESRFLPVINIVASLQGPTNQITALQQETEPPQLTFTPPPAALTTGASATLDTVSILNANSYLRKRGLTVISAAPAKMRLEVDHLEQITRSVEFHPQVAVDHITGLPDQVTVTIPSRTLQEIGGPEKLRINTVPGQNLSTLPIGKPLKVSMRFVPEYADPHDDRVIVTPAQVDVTLTVSKREAVTHVVPDVPVWVSGPPALLARYDVDLRPKFVSVAVSGSESAIQSLKDMLAKSVRGTGGGDQGIHAFLDVSLDDRPAATFTHRSVRYVLPDGLIVQDAPPDVEFRLVEVNGTQPAGSAAPRPASAP